MNNVTAIDDFISQKAVDVPIQEEIKGEEWRGSLERSGKDNKISKTMPNCVKYLQNMEATKGIFKLCEFTGKIYVTAPLSFMPNKKEQTPIHDHDYGVIAVWLTDNFCPNNPAHIPQAITTVACQDTFHPVRDYLNAVKWDKQPRLEGWLFNYLGVEVSEFSMAVATRWMVAAVKRIFEPGCKCDYMLVLEGAQGKRKSTALNVLAGKWFVEELDDIGSKGSREQLQGAWIVEIAEIDKLSKKESGEVKTFLTQKTDNFRGAYLRNVEERPRQCIFAGTVNPDIYLADETGGRRYWPVKCTAIDIEGLERDRDQLWAEAVELYKQGHPIYLETDELEQLARIEQAKRFMNDAWTYDIIELVACRHEIYMNEVLEKLVPEISQRNNSHSARIKRVITSLGFRSARTHSHGIRFFKEEF